MQSNRKLAVALLLIGVAAVGCGGANVNQHVSTVSQGEQLTDLKRALDAGAIDQKNYEKLQKKILEGKY